jgi:hypothetical protein
MSIPQIKIRQFNPKILEKRRLIGSPPTIVVIGKRGSGKCLGKDTPVMLANGILKMVQYINTDDKLMGDDSSIRNVLSVTDGFGNLYRIKQISGNDYIVNGEHILSLKFNKEYQIINGTHLYKGDIFDISVNDYIKLNKYNKTCLVGYKVPIVFDEKKVVFDPYIIGLWLGDKIFTGTHFTNQDSIILHYLVHTLPEYKCYLSFKNNSYSILGKQNKNLLLDTLNNLNIINNKHIPDIYKYNSRENQLKLLAGIIDTDGSYNKECYVIVQKNYILVKDIEFIVRCLGFIINIVECKKICQTRAIGTYYRLTISGTGLEDIPCLISSKKAQPRKQFKKNNLIFNNLHTEISIEPIGKGKYYGFQIDGNQRFVLGDHTVTHNSTLIADLMWHMRRIPMFICMSGTEEGNGFYGKHMHPLLIHGDYKKDIVSNLIKQQKDKLKKCIKAGIEPNSRPDLGTGLLLDDCGFDDKIMKSEDMRILFMNGRHWKICFIVSLQYMMGLPPKLRTNVDFVFCLRENIIANQKRLYDYFFGGFKKFAHFQEAFNKCTNNYECLVLDNTSKSTKIEDCVFYYRAFPNRDYKLGSKDLWNYLDSRYKADDDDDDDLSEKVQSSVVIKKAPMVCIVDKS